MQALVETIVLEAASNDRYNTTTTGSDVRRPQFRPFQVKQWDFYLRQATAFRQQHGHCMISRKTNANPELVMWAKRQRCLYREYLKRSKCKELSSKDPCQMTPERIAVLNNIDFCWNTHEIIWEERYQELKEFGRVYGHYLIPIGPRGLPKLGNWVKGQRRQYKLMNAKKRTSMTRHRIKKLEEIGFSWIPEKSLKRLITQGTTTSSEPTPETTTSSGPTLDHSVRSNSINLQNSSSTD